MNEFVEKIIHIDDPVTGSGAGSVYALLGASSSSRDLLGALKRQAVDLTKVSSDKNSDDTRILELANDIEGSILGLQALSILTAEQGQSLISELREVTDGR